MSGDSYFIGAVRIEALPWHEAKQHGGKRSRPLFRTLSPLSYHSALLGETITVSAGYITDFASVPRCLWPLLSPDDYDIQRGSLIHDLMYQRRGQLTDNDGEPFSITRQQADSVLVEAMAVDGAPLWKRRAVYRALRLFGHRWK